MAAAALPHARPTRRESAQVLLVGGILAWLWVLPFFRHRGPYLWGRFAGWDLLVGALILPFVVVPVLARIGERKRARRRAVRLAAFFLASYFTLAACDLAYSTYRLATWSYWFDRGGVPRNGNQIDPELGWVRPPHINWKGKVSQGTHPIAYHGDENGFRNPDGIRTADIIFLGDSFTEAVGVEDSKTYVRLVEQATSLKAVNLGRTGYSPPQEMIAFRRYGLNYHPRFIVWQLFEGNDLQDAEDFVPWRANAAQREQQVRPKSWFGRYVESSEVVRLIRETRPRNTATLHLLDGQSKRVKFVGRYEGGVQAAHPFGARVLGENISEMTRLCKERGIHLLVIVIPLRERVLASRLEFRDQAEKDRLLPFSGLPQPGDFAATAARYCAKNRCDFIDTYPILKANDAADGELVYFSGDPHLDRSGHRLVADAIVRWIHSIEMMK